MPQIDLTSLLTQVAPLSERKNAIEIQINNLVNEKRQVDDEIKKLLTHVNALVNGSSVKTTLAVQPSSRGRRRGRNGMQNNMTLQSAITKILENRAYWGVEHADADGLKTREIADAISNAQIWSPSNPTLFLGQVSQTISRMKKEGIVRQENDRRYTLIAD